MRVLGQTAMIFNIFVSKEKKDSADSLYQLIHSQPLNPENLESSFPPFVRPRSTYQIAKGPQRRIVRSPDLVNLPVSLSV